MIKNKFSSQVILIFICLLTAGWILYSLSFNETYEEIKIFATEGAQPIIQILEILNYRGEEIKNYFILFFVLTSLSFLLLIYSFLFIKKKRLSMFPIVIAALLLLATLIFNSVNKLAIVWLLLIGISLLVMASITLTVKYLYMSTDSYENGDILQTGGPFEDRNMADIYVSLELDKIKSKIDLKDLEVLSHIYSEEPNGYYVDIYLEDVNESNGVSNNDNKKGN